MDENVAPFVGAWIEIMPASAATMHTLSLRSSERGLKYNQPHQQHALKTVAPFVGAWIEILDSATLKKRPLSLRSSERGLKYRPAKL